MKKLIDKINESEKNSLRNTGIGLCITILGTFSDYDIVNGIMIWSGGIMSGWYGKPVIDNIVDSFDKEYFKELGIKVYESL